MQVKYTVRLARLATIVAFALGTGVARGQDPVAEPDNVTRAESLADEAYAANARRDYARAVALYQLAFEAAPSADILYNIAHVYDVGLRDRPLAIAFYRRYLADPGASSERIEKVNQRLQQLREAEATLASMNAIDAATRAGTRRASGPRGSHDTVPADEKPYWSAERGAALTAGALGVVGLGVGTIFTLSAIAKNRDAEADCDGDRCRTQRGVDASKSARQEARIATIALSAGGVLAVAGGVLWWVSSRPDAQPRDALASIRWTPIAANSRFGIEISGGF